MGGDKWITKNTNNNSNTKNTIKGGGNPCVDPEGETYYPEGCMDGRTKPKMVNISIRESSDPQMDLKEETDQSERCTCGKAGPQCDTTTPNLNYNCDCKCINDINNRTHKCDDYNKYNKTHGA